MLKKTFRTLSFFLISFFSSLFLLSANGHDISVSEADIRFEPPSSAVAGTQVVISIAAYNLRGDDINDATADVKVYLDNKESRLASWSGKIDGMSGVDLTVNWDTTAVPPGDHSVIVEITNVEPKESNSDNNKAEARYLIFWRR